MNKKIAIAGLGVVGEAVKEIFPRAICYDPPKNIGTEEELNEADIIFICVPTPYNYKNGCDVSAVVNVISILSGEKIIVIKSTIIPGTTDKLQAQFPQHKILFNPEFLTQDRAKEEIKKPDRQIIGYTDKSKNIAEEILNLLPDAPYKKIMLAKEAEMIKYFNNCWFATKVIFANQIYDICEKLGIDYEQVKEGAAADHRMTGTSHLEIWHKGYRGYGNLNNSMCLPKDLLSLVHFADKNRVNLSLLKEVHKLNLKYGKSV